MTPEKLALCAALGIVLGIFPVPGSTTLLCGAAAFAFGLNQPVIQLVNYLVYPLQLVLLIPWYRLGEKLFHVPPLILSRAAVKAIFAQGIARAVITLWNVTIHAIVAWCLVAPGLTAFLCLILRLIFRRLAKQVNSAVGAP